MNAIAAAKLEDFADAIKWRWIRDHLTYGNAGPHYGWMLTEVIPDPDSNGPDWAVTEAISAELVEEDEMESLHKAALNMGQP